MKDRRKKNFVDMDTVKKCCFAKSNFRYHRVSRRVINGYNFFKITKLDYFFSINNRVDQINKYVEIQIYEFDQYHLGIIYVDNPIVLFL